ncbi:MAG: hypothetical protein V4773_19325, partial [Verrucomicrobiota bacterium]
LSALNYRLLYLSSALTPAASSLRLTDPFPNRAGDQSEPPILDFTGVKSFSGSPFRNPDPFYRS